MIHPPEFLKRVVSDAVSDAINCGLTPPMWVCVSSSTGGFLVAHYTDAALKSRTLAMHPRRTAVWSFPL